MKGALLNYIRSKPSEVILTRKNPFLESIFPQNSNITIDSRQFTATYNYQYHMGSNKTCDLLLKSNNSEIDIWIEGKKEVKLLPVNCCQIPERIILNNDSSYLDIARLIALVNNQQDLRLTLSTVNEETLEYYRRRSLCAEIISKNDNEIQLKSEFSCIDILPVEINRKKIVELYCNAILDNHFIKLPGNNIYIIVSIIEGGIVYLKVYRDIDNSYYECKKCCYGVDRNGDNKFLSKYFPSS